MADLIDRQAAIDANCEDWCGYKNTECPHKSEPYKYCDGCDTVGILKEIPSAHPEQRWIPVSERLPEEYGNYLITTDDDNVYIGTTKANLNGWSGCDANGFFWWGEKVVAWMPLPEPYQERGE